jgi:hypothetical protein
MPRPVTEEEARRFARFWEVMEAHRKPINDVVEKAALGIPVFAVLIEAMPQEVRAAQEEHGREMQRRALVEGRWDEYLLDLRTQGKTYAEMGIAFADWFELLGAYRAVVLEPPRHRHVDARGRLR